MLPMPKRSKLIRLSLLPIFLVIWVIGLVLLVASHLFDYLWETIDKVRDSFESWVNRVAPLDDKRNLK